jgi:hypothetical protein
LTRCCKNCCRYRACSSRVYTNLVTIVEVGHLRTLTRLDALHCSGFRIERRLAADDKIKCEQAHEHVHVLCILTSMCTSSAFPWKSKIIMTLIFEFRVDLFWPMGEILDVDEDLETSTLCQFAYSRLGHQPLQRGNVILRSRNLAHTTLRLAI